MSYQNPTEPAENINVLLAYLKGAESPSSSYIYRGQVKEWDTPLIPSIYRRMIGLDQTFNRQSQEYRHSLRHCGNQFIGIKPDSNVQKIVQDNQHLNITGQEYSAIAQLAYDPGFALLVSIQGYESALEQRIVPQTRPFVMGRLALWRSIIDDLNRATIRQIAFLQPFGYMLGMTLAQQYGFASELLDFTANLHVAGFFATHDAPYYRYEHNGSGNGVIYRLPSDAGNVRYDRIDSYNYYTSPSQLHLRDLCMRFEDKSSPEMSESLSENLDHDSKVAMLNGTIVFPQFFEYSQFKSNFAADNLSLTEKLDQYLHLYYYGGHIRYYRLLDMPMGSFDNSRLGRQRAVMVVPDELRIESDEGDWAEFQAIEDVMHRDEFERFYFRHTAVQPELGEVNREYLWPREDDVFKTLITRVLLPTTEMYEWNEYTVPKRLDLVSSGYEN